MIQRELRVPVPAGRLWAALTDPDELRAWWGSEVAWDLRPGAAARFGGDGGEPDRDGVVAEVEPGRLLRFLWWPAGGGEASEVCYELEDEGDSTLLRVTEAPAAPVACALDRWTATDGALLGLWASCMAGAAARA